MPLQDFQIQQSQRYIFILRPDEEDARCLRPRQSVADGDEVIVRFEGDDLGFQDALTMINRDKQGWVDERFMVLMFSRLVKDKVAELVFLVVQN